MSGHGARVLSLAVLTAVVVTQACSSTSVNPVAPQTGGGAGTATGGSGTGGNGTGGSGTGGSGTGGASGAGSGGVAGQDGSVISDAASDAQVCNGASTQPKCPTPSGATSCPATDQYLIYLCVDTSTGDAELVNQADGRTYWCSPSSSQPSGEHDCKTDFVAQDTVKITSLGSVPTSCSCNSVFKVGTPSCTYDCRAAD